LAVLAGNDPDLNWESSIKVFNISLSGAMNFKEKLNVGAAFHLVRGSMTMDKGLANPAGGGLQYSEESDGWGFGFGLGAQYLLNKKITLGAAMRTAMSVNFKGEADNPLLPIIAPMYGTTAPAESDFEREITWPLWVGGGIAYRPMEKLLLALEAQWSRWGYYEDELVAEFDNSSWEQILTANGGNTIHLHWDNATQIRLGGEYLLNDKIALRGGFYIDPAPGPDETQTILIPNTDFTVITCGFGYKPMCNLNIDFGFEYLIGKERNVTEVEYNNLTTPPTPIGMLGKHGMSIVVPSIAVTYHFCSGKDKPCGSCKGTCK
jgi:long-chain fatty acid transport protein